MRPLPSTTILPSDVLDEATVGPELDDAAAGVELPPPLLPQPAATSAISPIEATVAICLRVIRILLEGIFVLLSKDAGRGANLPHRGRGGQTLYACVRPTGQDTPVPPSPQ